MGQLNFFRWAIDNELLTYINKHYDLIQSDMNETLKKKKKINNITNEIYINKNNKNINSQNYHNILSPIKQNYYHLYHQKVIVKFN